MTDEFFDYITSQAGSGCPGKKFYTRDAFLNATDSYYMFGRVGSYNDSLREIAAAFAHFTYETGRKLYIFFSLLSLSSTLSKYNFKLLSTKINVYNNINIYG